MNRCICCGNVFTPKSTSLYCDFCLLEARIDDDIRRSRTFDDSNFDDSDHLDSTFKNGESK